MLFVAVNSFFLVLSSDSVFAVPVTVKTGEDVVLQCQAPRGTVIRLLEWIRPDLQNDGNVFFYRNNRAYDKYQHPSFRGRVELRDPQMKDGDTSVILKNVSISDTGTYDCQMIVSDIEGERTGTEIASSQNLTVTDSGYLKIPVSGVEAEDKREDVKTDAKENNDINVGPVAESAFAVPVTVKTGEDVVLQCQAPRGTVIRLLEWIRPDLQNDGNVFFYRNNRAYDKYQHPSFRGRVELRDPQMKDGDTSVILKNVSISDTGTYDCRIIVSDIVGERTVTEIASSQNLTVTDSGYLEIPVSGGGAEDVWEKGQTEKVISSGENKNVIVGLVVGLLVFALLLCVVMLIRNRQCVKTFYQRVSQREGERPKVEI
ncbi:hypothetical protein Q5P01_000815 [Channa striata]|uniref:Ig-like domain-containing protein n=1 Tax=Channa striata TaxID=64152 RepID=A0AA88IWW3_CHASR|nr:hypothetical protein Q5P01_000815 [Channa striata]